ncbi:MAG: hypothetical protein AAB395_02425 [Patescibacteria group bacterium]
MSDPAYILVIILSVFLAVSLLLSIILLIMVITFFKRVNSVAAAVQATAENVESVVSGVSKVTSPMIIAKLIMKQFNQAAKGKGK